jgi:hypothetical protein
MFSTTFKVTGSGLKQLPVKLTAAEKFQLQVLNVSTLFLTVLFAVVVLVKGALDFAGGSTVLGSIELGMFLPLVVAGNALSKLFVVTTQAELPKPGQPQQQNRGGQKPQQPNAGQKSLFRDDRSNGFGGGNRSGNGGNGGGPKQPSLFGGQPKTNKPRQLQGNS